MASDENAILEMVSSVLAPLGEERKNEVLAWAAEYLKTCPLVAYVCAKGEPGDIGPEGEAMSYEFKLGDPSPLDRKNTIFAIFHWYTQGVFVVYSFVSTLLEEGGEIVGATGTYSRDVVFEPRFASGPVSLEAMHQDLNYHLSATPWDDMPEPDDGPSPGPNGRPPALGVARS